MFIPKLRVYFDKVYKVLVNNETACIPADDYGERKTQGKIKSDGRR